MKVACRSFRPEWGARNVATGEAWFAQRTSETRGYNHPIGTLPRMGQTMNAAITRHSVRPIRGEAAVGWIEYHGLRFSRYAACASPVATFR